MFPKLPNEGYRRIGGCLPLENFQHLLLGFLKVRIA
jgi:hypothetical protein